MISVCLATYNGENFVNQQINSILHQLNTEDELIISDDGSTDKTLSIIETYNDPRIIVYRNSFQDPVRNFEFLIGQAKGDYIFLSDQDDIWATDKVKIYKEYFYNDPQVSLILSDIQIIDKEGLPIKKFFYPKGFRSGLIQNIFINNFIGCSMAFKREINIYILPFPKKLAMHDWWIGTCCIVFGKIHFIDKKLLNYRRHDSNFTKDSGNNLMIKLRWRYILMSNLLLRYLNKRINR